MQKRLRPWHLLVLLLALAAGAVVSKARVLEGDMEVAGGRPDLPRRSAPPPVLAPQLKYAYSCRAELNDGLEYRGRKIRVDGRKVGYDLWAYAEFVMNQDIRYVQSENLTWKWMAVVEDDKAEDGIREIPLAHAPKDAFSTRGHTAYLRVDQGNPGEELRVTLLGRVKLPVGDFYRTEMQSDSGPISQERFTVQVDASLAREGAAREGEPAQLWRRLYVRCAKIQ